MSLPIVKSGKPLVGWRGWNVMVPGFLATSTGNHATVWLPGERTEAICIAHPDKEGVPHEYCMCGLWAFNSAQEIFKQNYSRQTVLGEVWLWGRVIECEKGFRAEYAYPKKLYATQRMIDANVLVSYLAFRYDIDLEVIPEDHVLVASDPEERRRQLLLIEQARQAKQLETARKRMKTREHRLAAESAAAKMPSTKGYKNLLEEIEAETKELVRKQLEGREKKL